MSKPRTGAPKRVAVGLLAGALAVFGVALAPPAGAAANVTNERLAGATRYGTAAAIAGDEAFATPTMAIVATGENFPDALAASSLAGANAAAPIILTQTGSYTAEAKAGMDALKAKGVTAATIVGGTAAVSDAVEEAIKADGFTVTRVAGEDRYETAAAIATAANTKSPAAAIGGLKPGLFATGLNFPDALAGGPAAYANKIPLLLVNDTVPAETANAISTIGIKKAYVLGGTAAVSSAVEAQLVQATGNPVTRLAGVNRYSTAAAIGDFEATTLAFPVTSVVLATGTNFPDALAAGPLGGQLKAPIVLTSSLPEESRAFLDKHSPTIQKLYVAGGTSAIDDATVAAAEAAAENVSNDSAGRAVTTRPELTGAQIVETVTALNATVAKPAGTYVRFTFDEAISQAFGATATNFQVYSNSNTQYDGDAATIDAPATGATTTSSVLVRFNSVNTPTLAGALSKATVAFSAVRDASGAENPEGQAPVGTAGTTTSVAGTTSAPDLTNVSGFRSTATVGQTAVDFTFDVAAFVATPGGFHLVDTANRQIDCQGPAVASSNTTAPGGGNLAGGNGTTTITAICTNPDITGTAPNGTPMSAANTARGFVDAGAVSTVQQPGGGSTNPLQAHDVASNSTGPDLVSVSFTRGTAGTANPDSVVYTFDSPILQATGNLFRVYTNTGAEVAPSGGNTCTTATSQTDTSACAINASNPQQVLVRYANGTVDTAVGASAQDSAATASTTGLPENQEDEVGAAGTGSTTITPGSTSGPDLTTVVLSTTTDAFGNTGAYQAVYTFDESVTVANTTGFYLHLADGTRLRSGNCTVGSTTATAAQVTCTGFVNAVTGVAPTPASTVGGSVLGTVQEDVVFGAGGAGTDSNTEGAAATTGGTGTPAS